MGNLLGAVDICPLNAGLMRTARLVLIVLAAIVLASRTVRDQCISEELARQHSAGGPLELARIGPDTWRRVCVLGLYTTNATAALVLGFPWNVERQTSIGTNDGINLLVFVRDREVVAFAEHPRNKGDFLHLSPRCFERQAARLLREVGADSWVQYVAK